jgi:hypothetical protein
VAAADVAAGEPVHLEIEDITLQLGHLFLMHFNYCRHDTCVVYALDDMERILRLDYAKIRSQPPTSGCIFSALVHLQWHSV